MDPIIVTYVGFFVAVVIIIWAALEFRSRLSRFYDQQEKRRDLWVKLDPKLGPSLPDEPEEEEQEEEPEQNLQTRAKQNGHHSNTTYPF
jgi:preprotein translocase subunit Sec61beta